MQTIRLNGKLKLDGNDTYVLWEQAGVGRLVCAGTVVPSDTKAGYATGCLFLQTDGGVGTAMYINEGTVSSADFNQYNNSGVDLSTLTATAAEINQAADESANTEVVTGTNVILGSESGKTFYLNAIGGFTSTLPAVAAGLRFRFIIKTAPTTAYIITTNGGDNVLYGMMLERAGTAGVAGAARDTFNFVANQAIIGDWVEFWCDGTNWYYHGMVDVAAGNTVAAT